MAKLTTGQVAIRLNISSYTLKRWYAFWEKLANTDVKELNELVKNGMPALPSYEIAGSRGDRLWDEEDIDDLIAFKNWVPNTRGGIFSKYLSKNEEE